LKWTPERYWNIPFVSSEPKVKWNHFEKDELVDEINEDIRQYFRFGFWIKLLKDYLKVDRSYFSWKLFSSTHYRQDSSILANNVL
jgi:hypothetical protein